MVRRGKKKSFTDRGQVTPIRDVVLFAGRERRRRVEVRLVDIDPRVEPDNTFPGACGVYLVLSTDPGIQWAREFERQWKMAPHGVKRRMTVVGDRLRITLGPRDHVEEVLSIAADLVEKTNRAFNSSSSPSSPPCQ